MGSLHPTSCWKRSSKIAYFSCWQVLLWKEFRLEGCPGVKVILIWISDWGLDRRNYCSAAGVHRGVETAELDKLRDDIQRWSFPNQR
ncbi:hypothetical protein H5410_007393 [Solanum commersonii]|uniref:Uncharacterized protein n=1 Tax=Solanum commersonii TaxID=4109 RepID=A0A9J6AE00_SOLCO|nr:hypothetical protein H5410_007393 [Solanum commersonii]